MRAMNDIPTHARVLLSIAALALLVATIGGALASHALAGVDERTLQSFTTAVQFLFFHGLGLVALTLVGLHGIGGRWLWLAAGVIVAGALLFCGSIFAHTFGAPAGVVAVAPYGGVLLMLGWIVFGLSVWRRA
jgi:uncharacterized membrane protein YgdD (TMEM256/DUF423 family)